MPIDSGLAVGEFKGGGILKTVALSEISILGILYAGFSHPLPFLFFLYWIRASFPRIRIDHMLSLGWSYSLVLRLLFFIA
jgi:NADH:ubiquinone oxidoreductase subunit H